MMSFTWDVSASGFYISNMDNHIIGNSPSGGWSGFAVPILPEAVGLSQASNVIPSAARGLTFDGNTAHNTGWWWKSGGGAFYLAAYFILPATVSWRTIPAANRIPITTDGYVQVTRPATVPQPTTGGSILQIPRLT